MTINKSFTVSGNIVDVVNKEIFQGTITVQDGKIKNIQREETDSNNFIMPGFIDAHVHIESSMLIPSEFARLAVRHGTVATVSDPHEIANVMGIDGVKFMIKNGEQVPFKFFFGAPSCVPATPFESSGAAIGTEGVEELLKMDKVKYLSEMMNFPGVLFGDEEVKKKLDLAKKYNKVIDGHAPGLKGEDAEKYIKAGISTDHECFTIEEALNKISYGMKILIREGSAAKNFDALIPLIEKYPDMIMFCSDDKHPNDLIEGHINLLVKRAIAIGYDPIKVLRACIYNPVKHYGLEVGLLQKECNADFIIADNLTDLNILATYINGVKVAENGKSLLEHVTSEKPNIFNASKITKEDIKVVPSSEKIKVIKALDGQLITDYFETQVVVENDNIVSDINNDILKLVVMNRYQKTPPAIGFINNFNLKRGAIASTVAHDSHNIIALGTNDKEISEAINLLVDSKGGVSVVDGEQHFVLPLPVAGLMSDDDGFDVAEKYDDLDKKVKQMGCTLSAPFMTLSFMALLVIPHLKLSDKGLFDGDKFEFTRLQKEN